MPCLGCMGNNARLFDTTCQAPVLRCEAAKTHAPCLTNNVKLLSTQPGVSFPVHVAGRIICDVTIRLMRLASLASASRFRAKSGGVKLESRETRGEGGPTPLESGAWRTLATTTNLRALIKRPMGSLRSLNKKAHGKSPRLLK